MEFRRLHGVHLRRPAEEAPCPGKWTVNALRKIALYGHDAKNMKNITLHFDNEDRIVLFAIRRESQHTHYLIVEQLMSGYLDICYREAHVHLRSLSILL